MQTRSLHAIPDDELLLRLGDLLCQSRRTESDLVAHIAEVDKRRLYAREAFPSMFAHCTEVLHLSEAEAYLRIAAGRASREHPLLLEMLADGRLHLTGIGKLAPHLTRENAAVLLARAAHKTKGQILELIAEVAPQPDTRTAVRKLLERPFATSGESSSRLPGPVRTSQLVGGLKTVASASEPRPDHAGADSERPRFETKGDELRPDAVAPRRDTTPAVLEPLSPGRYKIQFTADAAFKKKLERLQALLFSPAGDLAAVLEAAVTEKLERLEAKRFGRTRGPRKKLPERKTAPTTRHIPAAVRRSVHERDGGRCRFVDARGRRCSERIRLEFHHRYPLGRGGDHSPPNVALLCRAHNRLMAEQDYGREILERDRAWQPAAQRLVVTSRPK